MNRLTGACWRCGRWVCFADWFQYCCFVYFIG